MSVGTRTSEDIAQSYERDGFVFPIDAVDADEAAAIRADLEAAEAELADDPRRLGLTRGYPSHLLPSFDRLVRNPNLIAAASSVLGPDLMVWGSGLFIKEANSPHIVSWHQDLTYWGLDDVDEVTCWVALSPATVESGCMKFVAGSHRDQLVEHVDTFSEHNLLTRGQEVARTVDESDATHIVLRPGQASMHHGHLIHGSDPNTTDDRRLGAAIRYIRPSMKQRTGDRSLATLVAGEDRHGNFTLADPPQGRLAEANFEACLADAKLKKAILYAGAEPPR